MKLHLSFMIPPLKNFKLTNELLEIVGVKLSVCPCCVSLFLFLKTTMKHRVNNLGAMSLGIWTKGGGLRAIIVYPSQATILAH